MKTLILGSAVLDMVMNVDALPSTMEDVHPSSVTISLGGMAYNVYEILKYFECDAILGAPAGTGFFSEMIIKMMAEKGVKPWVRIKDKDNGLCLCLVEKSGERTFISHHGAEYMFDAEWFNQLDFNEIERIYVSGLEIEEPTGEAMLKFLEEKRKPILFAPGPRLLKIPQDRVNRLLDLNVMLHINEKEALQLSGKNDYKEAANVLYQRTSSPVIITLGDKGAWIKDGNEEMLIEARKAKVVDTIGAGDSHAGAVLAMLQEGKSLKEAVRVANIVASFVIESAGAGLSSEEFKKVKEAL